MSLIYLVYERDLDNIDMDNDGHIMHAFSLKEDANKFINAKKFICTLFNDISKEVFEDKDFSIWMKKLKEIELYYDLGKTYSENEKIKKKLLEEFPTAPLNIRDVFFDRMMLEIKKNETSSFLGVNIDDMVISIIGEKNGYDGTNHEYRNYISRNLDYWLETVELD